MGVESEMEKLKFLEEIERDAARRNDERKQREAVAQNLRKYLEYFIHVIVPVWFY